MCILGITVPNLVLENDSQYCVLVSNLFKDIIPTDVTYNLTIVFLVFRELVSVSNNDCFHT